MVRLHLSPLLGHHALSKLSPLDVQGAYSKLSERLAARTVLHIHRLLYQALAQGVRWGLVVRNVAEAVEPPRPQSAEMDDFGASQIASLLELTKDSRLRIPIVLAVTCGLRRGECLALKWSDVDLETGKLQVSKSLEETIRGGLLMKGTKSGRGRQVILMGMAVATLRHHRAEQARIKLQTGGAYNPDDLVSPGLNGGPWRPSVFTDSFSRLMKRLNLPITFHGLRHSHASLGLSTGVHPKVMSERLGHSTVGITLDTYSHVVSGLQEQAVGRMEGALQVGK